MRYDVLLCDADNTLFDFNKAEENAFAMACETMGFSSTPELLATYSKITQPAQAAESSLAPSRLNRLPTSCTMDERKPLRA